MGHNLIIALILGRYCCLWCLITQSELKEPQSERGLKEERTVEKLVADYDRFKEAGSVISKAKQYNNCIRPPLINVPIDQVVSLSKLQNKNPFYSKSTFLFLSRYAYLVCTSALVSLKGYMYCSWKHYIPLTSTWQTSWLQEKTRLIKFGDKSIYICMFHNKYYLFKMYRLEAQDSKSL